MNWLCFGNRTPRAPARVCVDHEQNSILFILLSKAETVPLFSLSPLPGFALLLHNFVNNVFTK